RRALMREGVTHDCLIEIEGDEPIVMADGEYLTVALMHLIDNAIKFSPNQSHVTVRVHSNGMGETHVAIEDRGRGIPAHEMSSIWNTFYQIKREVHEDQGAGSGLAIARGFVEMHNGRIDVQS